MDEEDRGESGSVTRLGPDSGGKAPGDSSVSYREWSWSTDSAGRPGLPLIGLFLVAFGVLLLLERLVPGSSIWSWLSLGIGAAALVGWASRRPRTSGFLLYLGVILVAIGLPSLLTAIGLLPDRDGWGTLFLGVALLALGLTRRTGPGIPASVWIGGVLALIGLSETALLPDIGSYLFPIIVIGIGGLIILRAVGTRPG
jgi:hypothetical protein